MLSIYKYDTLKELHLEFFPRLCLTIDNDITGIKFEYLFWGVFISL
jgi:hypothetical protein